MTCCTEEDNIYRMHLSKARRLCSSLPQASAVLQGNGVEEEGPPVVCAASIVSFLTMPYALCVPCAMVCPAFLKVSPRLVKKLLASALVPMIAVAIKQATRKACHCVDLMLCFRSPLAPVKSKTAEMIHKEKAPPSEACEVRGSCLKLQAELAEPSLAVPSPGSPTCKVCLSQNHAARRKVHEHYVRNRAD